jgi:hypothetical protein
MTTGTERMSVAIVETDGPAEPRVRPVGPAVAAILSIGIGGILMAIVVGISDANKAFEADVIHALGKLWVPGAQGIGPYSGKFTVFLLGWLLSWAGLHVVFRRRDVDLAKWAIASFALIGLAILLIWPPITLAVFVR